MVGKAVGYMRRNAVACVALFIALGGTATASHLVVRASDIQRNAVRAKHIKKDSVRLKQVHRGNVSRAYGSGLLGGQGILPAVGGNVAGGAGVSPIGSGQSFAIPIPRRARVRDLAVRANVNMARPVGLRIHNGGEVVLACEIPIGSQTCDSGGAAALFRRGDILSMSLLAPPHPVAIGQTSYEFGYRISP